MKSDWGDYAHPKSGCLPIIIVVVLVSILGCATVKSWEAKQLLNQYGCRYYEEESGFCCEKQIPEEHRWITNCIYGKEL